uniref:Uncharacterized protein n=1 Tax=Nothobranchius pienaari TaxID=704102 RepID=A0A1A8P0I5_9TELE
MDKYLIPPRRPRLSTEMDDAATSTIEKDHTTDCNSSEDPRVEDEWDEHRGEQVPALCEETRPDPLLSVPGSGTNNDSTLSDISQTPHEGPRRPILVKYQAKKCGIQMRSFNRRWYEQCSWQNVQEPLMSRTSSMLSP